MDTKKTMNMVKMLKEMQDQSVANLCIYIVHEHAGIHIGPKCHIIIQKVLCEGIQKQHRNEQQTREYLSLDFHSFCLK